MHEKTSFTHAKIDGVSNVLLASSTARADDACADFVSQNPSAESNLLGITYSQSAYDRLDVWEHGEEHPPNTTVIDVGACTRSAQAGSTGSVDVPGDPYKIKTIADETDLVGLGQGVLEELSAFGSNGNQTTVCFHSITGLLEHVDEETAFRFLHILTSRFASANVSAHYHVNTDAHDEKTIRMFSELFESVIELDESGD